MGAVVMLAGVTLRHRWRSVVVLTLLVAFAGGVTLALVAGARRTSTSLSRFESWSRAADLEIEAGEITAAQLEQFRRSPGVAGVAELRQLAMFLPDGNFLPLAAQVDGAFGDEVDRARIMDGRAADPGDPAEVTVGESLARSLGLSVGDELRFLSYSPAQTADPGAGSDLEPVGPDVSLRVVGIVRRPLDLGARGAAGGVIVPTPAFLERSRDDIGSWSGSILRVRTEHGDADIARVSRSARRIFGASPTFAVLALGSEGAGAEDAISVTTAGLGIAALVAALTGLVAVGIATSREVSFVDVDQHALLALGLGRRRRAAAAAAIAVPVALVGALLAGLAAWLASPLFPFGVAGLAEPDPGMHADGFALAIGVLATSLLVLVFAGVAGVRVAGQVGREPARRATASPVPWFGRRPEVTIGVRFAVERGRRRDAVPVRSSLLGAVSAVAVLVAVLVFAGGLDRLITTPARYGWTWDLQVNDEQATDAGDGCGVATRLTSVRAVTSVSAICGADVEIQGRPVPAWAFRRIQGRIDPGIALGRAPAGPGEVALGADTLAAANVAIGDRITITGVEHSAKFTVVGEAVMPSFSDAQPLADAAVFTVDGVRRVGSSGDNWNLVVRLDPSADRAAALAELRAISGGNGPPKPAVLPAEIDRVRQIQRLPGALAVFVMTVALVGVGFALVSGVRRRRRQLAILKVLGFSRRQVRGVVAWHASTVAVIALVVGVPLGMVAGRVVWRAVADQLGVAADPAWPVLGILLLLPATLLAFNLLAAWPARDAARTRAAVVLRSE